MSLFVCKICKAYYPISPLARSCERDHQKEAQDADPEVG